MQLHLSRIGDNAFHYLDNQYPPLNPPIILDGMNQKKELNSLIIEISSLLNDVDFDDVEYYDTSKEMWDKMIHVHGRDWNY